MEAKFADLPDDIWEIVERLLPPPPSRKRGGRPRMPPRKVLAGIAYRLRTGCQWKAIPGEFGSGATCHRRFQEWERGGVFEKLHAEAAKRYDHEHGLDWRWASLDSATVKAPKGGT